MRTNYRREDLSAYFVSGEKTTPRPREGARKEEARRSLSLPIFAWYALGGLHSKTAWENSGREMDGKMTSNYPIVSHFPTEIPSSMGE